MKTRKIKRLELNKKTVSTLDNKDMVFLHGASVPYPSCLCQDTACCTLFTGCPSTTTIPKLVIAITLAMC